MANTTIIQRRKRMQSPYAIYVPVKTEYETTVIQVTGVYFQERSVEIELADGTVDYGSEVIEEHFDLGTCSNLKLAYAEGDKFRAEPELRWAQILRDREAEAA